MVHLALVLDISTLRHMKIMLTYKIALEKQASDVAILINYHKVHTKFMTC